MAFDIDPDRPNVPAIARILAWLGYVSLIACVGLMLLAFSPFPWVSQTLAMGGALGAFMFALIMIGQAKTMELLAVVSARVKSRFAMEGILAAQTAGQGVKEAEKKPMPATPQQPARVISIPESVAREQGLTRAPQPRDFG
jgi:hypothetical protein